MSQELTSQYSDKQWVGQISHMKVVQFSWFCWLGLHAYYDWKEWGPKIADRDALQQGRCMRCSKLVIACQ